MDLVRMMAGDTDAEQMPEQIASAERVADWG